MDKRKLIKIEKSKSNAGGFKVLFECLECGKRKWIKKSNYDAGSGSYCSYECRNKAHQVIFKGKNNPNYKGGLVEITCSFCGKKKEIKRKDVKRYNYCSRDCWHKDESKYRERYYIEHPETRKKVGRLGKLNGRYGKPSLHGKGDWYIRKDRTKVWMRSSYEIKFAGWLDRKNLKWEYEPKRFELKDRTYAPDFWIQDWNRWIEIKGWFHDRHQETVKQFREIYSRETLLVLTKPLLKGMSIL